MNLDGIVAEGLLASLATLFAATKCAPYARFSYSWPGRSLTAVIQLSQNLDEKEMQ